MRSCLECKHLDKSRKLNSGILYVLKPVGKLFIVDKNGNSLAKIDAENINTIADELDDCEVTEIYPSTHTEGMTLYPVLVVEIKIKEKGE